ncbi:MAG: zinc-ribbon domain-containing protein [Thermoplasmata archaeon]
MWYWLSLHAIVVPLLILTAKRARTGPRKIKVPKGRLRRAAARRVKVRTRPQVKAVVIKGQVKCDICLGVIKNDLPSVLCGCGKQFHNSCAMRTGTCPICGKELGYSLQKPHVVESAVPVIRTTPLSKDDKLLLLEERFLLGEITEKTYIAMKEDVRRAPDAAVFCSVCGRRLLEGELCDCTAPKRALQCPECGERLSEDDKFCRRCGVVFSTEFAKDLFQCPECGRVVAEDEKRCACGVLLVGEGNMICPECGAEVPLSSDVCPQCGNTFVEYISECPACGRQVSKDAVECECGVVFSDMVGGAECSVCGEQVDFADRFCPKCGARFADEPRLRGKIEREVRK